jgi:cardiolipin synthase
VIDAPNEPGATALLQRSPFAEVVVGSDRLAVLKDGGQTFSAMLAAIRAARSTICLETYSIAEDRTGQSFADALMERARAGIEVNLLYDGFGTMPSRKFLARLADAGVRTLAYRPLRLLPLHMPPSLSKLLRRDHRKILVVDGAVAFTGGINITDAYAAAEDGGQGWRDTVMRIEGPTAREVESTFLGLWRRREGAPVDVGRYQAPLRLADRQVRVVTTLSSRDHRQLLGMFREQFRSAESRILMTIAYFLPPPRMLREMQRAARRGVEVKLIHAGTTVVRSILWASWGMYGMLLESGVRVFEYRERVLHAKTMTVDGRWSTIGSTNFDSQSLKRSLEINVAVRDERFAAELERLFEGDLQGCQEVQLEDWKRWPLWKRLVAWLFYRFRNRL